MPSQLIAITTAAVMVAGSSGAVLAGGHGGPGRVMMPGAAVHGSGGWGGFHGGTVGGGFHGGGFGRAAFGGRAALPGVSGTIHVRAGRSPYVTGYGHFNTALPNARTLVRPVFSTYARGGYGRGRPALGAYPRYGYGSGYAGGYGAGSVGAYNGVPVIYGGGDAGSAPGGYGGSYDSGGGYGHTNTQGGGFSEAPLAAGYAEPPLNALSYGGDGAGRAGGGTWGPQIIIINNNNNNNAAAPRVGAAPRACPCRRSAAASPIVYRYGVGSPY